MTEFSREEKWLFDIFGQEVLRQVDDMELALQAAFREVDPRVVDAASSARFWFYMSAALAAAVRTANIIWPSSGSGVHQKRAKALRSAWGVAEVPSVAFRQTRNQLEHWDEYVDKWNKETVRHTFMDAHIGSPESVSGIEEGGIGRLFNPADNTVQVFGESTSLTDLRAEMVALRSQVVAGLAALRR